MSAHVRMLVSMLLILCGAGARVGNAAPAAIAHDGWTVTADVANGVLTVSHERLGVVLSDVRLAVRDEAGRVEPWATWVDATAHGDQLTVKTTAPTTTWLVEPLGEALRISSTSTHGLVIGTAPAPADRIVARLIDPGGTPVTWSGTGEVHSGYGGSYTQHPSFLPSRNAEVMYFSLGQTSAGTLHALFDLLLAFVDLARREVAVPTVDCLELAAVDGHDGLREQLQVTSQHDEATTDVSDADAVGAPEVGNGLEVRRQAAREPHQLDVALRSTERVGGLVGHTHCKRHQYVAELPKGVRHACR